MSVVAEQNINLCRSATKFQAFVDQIKLNYLLDSPARYEWERRQSDRMEVSIPAVITPLDAQLNRSFHFYGGITHDISYGGVGLTTTSPEATRHVLLTLKPVNMKSLSAIGIVRHCSDFGWHYRLGCEFLMLDDGGSQEPPFDPSRVCSDVPRPMHTAAIKRNSNERLHQAHCQ